MAEKDITEMYDVKKLVDLLREQAEVLGAEEVKRINDQEKELEEALFDQWVKMLLRKPKRNKKEIQEKMAQRQIEKFKAEKARQMASNEERKLAKEKAVKAKQMANNERERLRQLVEEARLKEIERGGHPDVDWIIETRTRLKNEKLMMDKAAEEEKQLKAAEEEQNKNIAELKQMLADKNQTELELENTRQLLRQEQLMLQKLQEQFEINTTKISKSNVEIENLNSELLALQNDKEETNKLVLELKQTLKIKEDQLQNSCEEVDSIKKNYEATEQTLKSKCEENEKYESVIEKLRADSTKNVEKVTSELHACRKEFGILLEENSQLKNHNDKLEEVEVDLNLQIEDFHKLQETGKKEIEVINIELESWKKETLKLREDLRVKREESESLLKEVSSQKENGNRLHSDYEKSTRENENFVTELAGLKLKYETCRSENLKYQDKIEGLTFEKFQMSGRLLECEKELEKLKIASTIPRDALDAEKLLGETKTLQNKIDKIQERCEEIEKQKRRAESQLCELENQHNEILQENQLLKDEVQKLKISPINIVNRDYEKLDNLDIPILEKVVVQRENNKPRNQEEEEPSWLDKFLNNMDELYERAEKIHEETRKTIDKAQNKTEELLKRSAEDIKESLKRKEEEVVEEKTLTVLNPFRTPDTVAVQDTDFAGPLVFCLAFGGFLLLSGKVHFSYIYGFGVLGCLLVWTLLSLMSTQGVAIGTVVTVLGYCLLPMVVLSGVNVVFNLQGYIGTVLTAVSILWCSLSASKLFVTALIMEHQQPLVLYPCALLYGVFALITIF